MAPKRAIVSPLPPMESKNPFTGFIDMQTQNVLKIRSFVEKNFLKKFDIKQSEDALQLLKESMKRMSQCQNYAIKLTRAFITGPGSVAGYDEEWDATVRASMKVYLEMYSLTREYQMKLEREKIKQAQK